MIINDYLAKVIKAHIEGNDLPVWDNDQETDNIIDVAKRNQITYMVFTAMLKKDRLSEETAEKLRNVVKNDVFLTLIQLNELKKIVSAFEENQVKNMPMKGSVIKYIYKRPELREMSDIDILIDEDDTEKAGTVLKSMGYKLNCSIKHHDIYSKGGILVEAHKSLYDKTVDNNQYKYFLGFDKAVLCDGYKYTYEFKPEDFYVYMLAHAAKHFYAMGCGIRNLADIYVYLTRYGKQMDRDYVDNELEKCGLSDFAKHMEILAFDWIDGKELDDFYLSLLNYMLDAGIYGKDENGIWNKFADEKKDKISRFELKRWYYFPPLYYMSEYYPWLDDHNWLLPIAWMIRFFRGVFLHKGKKKRAFVKNIKEDQIITYKRIYQKMNLSFSSK